MCLQTSASTPFNSFFLQHGRPLRHPSSWSSSHIEPDNSLWSFWRPKQSRSELGPLQRPQNQDQMTAGLKDCYLQNRHLTSVFSTWTPFALCVHWKKKKKNPHFCCSSVWGRTGPWQCGFREVVVFSSKGGNGQEGFRGRTGRRSTESGPVPSSCQDDSDELPEFKCLLVHCWDRFKPGTRPVSHWTLSLTTLYNWRNSRVSNMGTLAFLCNWKKKEIPDDDTIKWI